MTILQLAFLGVLFLVVLAIALFVLRRLTGNPIQARLDAAVGATTLSGQQGPNAWVVNFIKLTGPLAKLSLPDEGAESSVIRSRFVHAGFRNASAPTVFFSAKTILAISLPLLSFLAVVFLKLKLVPNTQLLVLLLAAAIGYYLPNIVLNHLIKQRQREIFETFPDALDLMTVCVEAGLGMDAALARVAAEIGLKSEVLAEEFHLVTLELRAGNAKEKALRNLALRTGVDDVDALVAMLIQAERFGTSIADSLRIQSDLLRTKRRQRAEEQAAKIALKLLFPLIFFIFPALLVVLVGPAFLQIYRVLLPGMAGTN
ncbi:MAG: tight adherence protein C [Burkholderiaceae bacterium]|jgi:tight adherence protein C